MQGAAVVHRAAERGDAAIVRLLAVVQRVGAVTPQAHNAHRVRRAVAAHPTDAGVSKCERAVIEPEVGAITTV